MTNASEPAKTADTKPVEPPPVCLRRMGPAPQGGFEVELKSEAVLILADKMGQVLKGADAPNFVVMTVHHPELGPLDITIQRVLGEPLAKQLLMGATNSAAAEEGTLRKKYGNPNVIRENAIHGSDSEESAVCEIAYWFAGYELL